MINKCFKYLSFKSSIHGETFNCVINKHTIKIDLHIMQIIIHKANDNFFVSFTQNEFCLLLKQFYIAHALCLFFAKAKISIFCAIFDAFPLYSMY